jgi:integrase
MVMSNSSRTRKPFDSYTKYALSETEIKRCLDVCNTTEKECIIRLGYSLGMRRSDMAGTEIESIDFTNHQISYFEEKKDKVHTAPMTPELEICLQKHINAGGKRKYLFEKPSGSTMYRRFQEILNDADIKAVGREVRPFHALRGTCYKYWQRRGMPVEQIAVLLDDTVETAMKHYGKATLNEISETMRKQP